MNAELTCVAIFAAVLTLSSAAIAGANNYQFELVAKDIRRPQAEVAVRLVHKPTGSPVPDAVVFRTRLDMSPDNMASMEAPLTPIASPEPGVYAFRTELSMAGKWLLSVAAKVQGESQTVVGKIIVPVVEQGSDK